MTNPFANAAAARTAQPEAQGAPAGFGQAQNAPAAQNAPQGHAPGTDPWGQPPVGGGFQGQSTPEPQAGPAGQFGGPVNGFQGQPNQAGQFGQAQNAQAPQAQGAPAGFAPQGQAQGYAQPAQNPGFGAPAADSFATAGPAQGAPAAQAQGGDPFSSPTGGGGARVSDYLGCLMLVKPLEFIAQMQTSIGSSDTIRGDAYILDGPNPGEEVTDMLFFQQALRRDLDRTMRGSSPYLLGRLARGVAKPGKSAPWIFETPTEADAALARQFLAYKASTN